MKIHDLPVVQKIKNTNPAILVGGSLIIAATVSVLLSRKVEAKHFANAQLAEAVVGALKAGNYVVIKLEGKELLYKIIPPN